MSALDPVDRQIIRHLRVNVRQPTSEIARRMGLAESMVRRRIERLFAEDIVRPMLAVSPTKANLVQASVGLKLDLRQVEAVAARVATLPEVVFAVLCAGPVAMFVSVLVPSQASLLSFLQEKLVVISGVLDCETSIALQVVKLAYVRPTGSRSARMGGQPSRH
jgi:Lrp/AsnC family transcriptional regulator for asnA, asnC and gidA